MNKQVLDKCIRHAMPYYVKIYNENRSVIIAGREYVILCIYNSKKRGKVPTPSEGMLKAWSNNNYTIDDEGSIRFTFYNDVCIPGVLDADNKRFKDTIDYLTKLKSFGAWMLRHSFWDRNFRDSRHTIERAY